LLAKLPPLEKAKNQKNQKEQYGLLTHSCLGKPRKKESQRSQRLGEGKARNRQISKFGEGPGMPTSKEEKPQSAKDEAAEERESGIKGAENIKRVGTKNRKVSQNKKNSGANNPGDERN